MTTMDRTGRRGHALAAGLLATVLGLAVLAIGEAAGPWRAQVMDAETGQPLEGVAVIGVWYRRPGGHPAYPIGPMGLVGSAEATTDAHGRFTLPFRLFFNPGLFTRIEEPSSGSSRGATAAGGAGTGRRRSRAATR